MAETESSDFLSSCDSLYSVASSTNDQENGNYVNFDVFLADGLNAANREREVYSNVDIHPNSRLSSTDHPALIRLENEYQARRSYFHQRPGQYRRYLQEIEGRISCPSHTNLTSMGSPASSRHEGGNLKHFVRSEGVKLEIPQGLKRQRKHEAELPADWWREKQELNLPKTEGDRIFAQKCRELQGFVKPLTDLLNGLKRGRYDRGLSSFQQSVAMDRIQRIIGVLQKPEMGERYLDTLLQVEMMLKVWFPGVSNSSSSPSSSSDYDIEEPQFKMAKLPETTIAEAKDCSMNQLSTQGDHSAEKPTEASPAGAQLGVNCDCCKEKMQAWTQWQAMNLTWMHTAPICNPPISQVDLHHITKTIGQDMLGPNSSNCGIILFLHNNLASSSALPRPSSAKLEEILTPVAPLNWNGEVTVTNPPPRTHSAPAFLPLSGKTRLMKTGSHSRSLPHLPTCTQRRAGDNT